MAKKATQNEKKTRDPVKMRAHILSVSFVEIYKHGFQGVGVRDIASAAGVTVGAFFHHFPSKSDVGYAIVDEFLRTSIIQRWIQPLAAFKNPLQGILKIFKNTFDNWPDEYLRLGCPLNNLAQEMSAVDPLFKEKTQSVLFQWIEETEKYLIQAKRDGYLKKNANTREMAEFIVSLQEAAFAMGKSLGTRQIFDSLYNTLKDYINNKSN